jgi:DNA-directed RNA polymerase specialized sigma24 family protein
VTLRHLVGLSIEETAAALNLSTAKVRKDWTFTKAWLKAELSRG